jgi:hypothetical protein
MIAMGMDRRNQVLVNWYGFPLQLLDVLTPWLLSSTSTFSFLAVAGAGTGLQIGPVSVQARFSLSAERVAVVTALLLFVSHRFHHMSG